MFHLTFSSSCIRGNSKWLFAAHLLHTAPQLPCSRSLQRSARRALIRDSLMTKLPYSFMTTSYDSILWQSYGNNFQCGHLSPSRGGWAINGLMQPSRRAAPSTSRCCQPRMPPHSVSRFCHPCHCRTLHTEICLPDSTQMPERLETCYSWNSCETVNLLLQPLIYLKGYP